MCVHPRRNVPALWSNEHALAWHLGSDFRADPVAWARTQCLNWETLEGRLPNFLEELPDCPCTLDQARADSGRFHVSPLPRSRSRNGQVGPAAPPPRPMGKAATSPPQNSTRRGR